MARLVVGGVWVVAGWIKRADPSESVRAVRAYDLLPEGLVPLVGHGLPVLELVVGVCLVLGLLTRPAAVASVVLLVAFVIGISSAWARGLSIECGCFGGGGGPAEGASDKYPWELARDEGRAEDLDVVLYNLAEGLRVVTLLLLPYVPQSAELLLGALGEDSREIATFGSRGGGRRVERIAPLFPKLESP